MDSVVFLIGSAYFCAGSYPQDNPQRLEIDSKHSKDSETVPLIKSAHIPIVNKTKNRQL
jgi:hypothetical protein